MQNPAVVLTLAFIPALTLFMNAGIEGDKRHPLVFGVFAETEEQKKHAGILAESIRTFAGAFKDAPVWIYMPESILKGDDGFQEKMDSLEVEVKTSRTPAASSSFYFAGKVFAAAEAEAEAKGTAQILAWLDEDTVVFKEPRAFLLDDGVSLAYRPVMHKNIGSDFSKPPDEFWSRVYEKLSVPEDSVFSMTTPADEAAIRPYFNAGLLVVRPDRGVLRKWAESFPELYEDPKLVEMCDKDVYKRIFLHQAALAGAILSHLKREEMVELSSIYNYPLFFHEKFQSKKKFDSVDEAVTIRYDVYFRNPTLGWSRRLKGPKEKAAWLRERFSKRQD